MSNHTSPNAITTEYTTIDGLRVYDLDPLSGDLYAVAGPDGIDPKAIDQDALPTGFRWVEGEEWASLFAAVNPLLAEAVQNGAAWGADEADLWSEQHPGKDAPEFTATWEGRVDHVPAADRDAYREAATVAAKAAWDEFFASR